MTVALLVATAAAASFGIASAWVPVLNAEAYVLVGAATAGTVTAWAIVAAVSAGQSLGKMAMFVAVRRGRQLAEGRVHAPRFRRAPGPWRRRITDWGTRAIGTLDQRWPAAGVITLAASVGVPPLAVVTVAAGARSTPLGLFGCCALLGRSARFAVLAAPVLLAR